LTSWRSEIFCTVF